MTPYPTHKAEPGLVTAAEPPAAVAKALTDELTRLAGLNPQAAWHPVWCRLIAASRFAIAHDEPLYDLTIELFDALSDFSPPDHSFGAHKTDLTHLGFWPDHEVA